MSAIRNSTRETNRLLRSGVANAAATTEATTAKAPDGPTPSPPSQLPPVPAAARDSSPKIFGLMVLGGGAMAVGGILTANPLMAAAGLGIFCLSGQAL